MKWPREYWKMTARIICILVLGILAAMALPLKREIPVWAFNGGTPIDFITQVAKLSKNNWANVLNIPFGLSFASVPPFCVRISDPIKLLEFYNHISQAKPELGTWIWSADGAGKGQLNYLMLTQDKTSTSSPSFLWKAKAFGIKDIPESKWEALSIDIDRAMAMAQQFSRSAVFIPIQYNSFQNASQNKTVQSRPGYVTIHNETSIIIAHGQPSFIEFVDSMISAYRTNVSFKPAM